MKTGVSGFRKKVWCLMKPRLRSRFDMSSKNISQPALVEEFIDGRELNVGVMEINGKMEVLPISEIDYSEFPEGSPRSADMRRNGCRRAWNIRNRNRSALLLWNAEMKKRLEQIAIEVFKLFECRDYARVDIRVDRDGKIYVIEVNPNPDISPQSGMARADQGQGDDLRSNSSRGFSKRPFKESHDHSFLRLVLPLLLLQTVFK